MNRYFFAAVTKSKLFDFTKGPVDLTYFFTLHWILNRQSFTAIFQFGFLVAVGQDSIMADSDKLMGYDMHGKTADKFPSAQSHYLLFAFSSVIFPSKKDIAVRHFYNAVIGDGHFVGVAPQIFDYMIRILERFSDVYYPFVNVQTFFEVLERIGR